MINLINGNLTENQEIIYYVNKESALQALSLHKFTIGEILIVGYYTQYSTEEHPHKDIMISVGINEGFGPESYRIISDRNTTVVTAVLDYLPDVSTVTLNQRYVAKDKENNKLYYLSRFKDPNTGELRIEQTELVERCLIIDASNSKIYICNPPQLTDFFDILVKPNIINLKSSDSGISIDIDFECRDYNDLFLINEEEKNILNKLTFEKNFNVSISAKQYDASNIEVNSFDPCVVRKTIYTLTAEYEGSRVELDTTPEGWEFDPETRLYTKEIPGNVSSNSESPVCIYTHNSYTGQKIAEAVSSDINKYFFILYSDEGLPSVAEVIRSAESFLVNSPKGNYTIKPRKDLYTWFLFPVGMEPKSITQMGINYIADDINKLNEVTWKNTSLGTYTLYHSIHTGNGLTQNIIIS